ncbi:T-complex protein 1 subunit gamma [Pancytospora philotis]|nr:T-complex protein 1 subunit gamma [Pancytospora philotis]
MQQPLQKAYILVSSDPNAIQKASAYAAKMLSSIVRTCLGPRAMQKMVLTKINSIELTNDGNSILREMDVSHPSARCLIELSQTQDDVCGDGTTSVIILAAELLDKAVPLLADHHPIRVCRALTRAKDLCLATLDAVSTDAKLEDLLSIIRAGVATKVCTILRVPVPELALRAATLIKRGGASDAESMRIDIKTDIKVEKILGSFEECEVLEGILLEKELVHPQMRKRIENPKILLIDSPLEYKKGESVTNLEFASAEDFTHALKLEEAQVRRMCERIVALRPDVVMTEKGVSELALSILYESNITAVRRIKKSDAIRIAKATGAMIMNRLEDIEERHLGEAGLFEYIKINKENYCKFSRCRNPRAVSVVLRGPSKDLLTELERNFMDAVKIAKNVLVNPALVPGGGSSEMSMLLALKQAGGDRLEAAVYAAAAEALRVIPSIIASNSGVGSTLDILNKLERRIGGDPQLGINGVTGELVSMKELVMEPIIVKKQCVKSAFEAVIQLLRVDGIIESKTRQ